MAPLISRSVSFKLRHSSRVLSVSGDRVSYTKIDRESSTRLVKVGTGSCSYIGFNFRDMGGQTKAKTKKSGMWDVYP